MKKLARLGFVVTVMALVAVTLAQSGPFSIGGMIGVDQKRLVVSPSVQFAMAAYTGTPPAEGFDNDCLSGFFSSALGMYPTDVVGMQVKVLVNPSGIASLEGVDFDPTGSLALTDKGWEPCHLELKGGWSTIIECDEPRPIVMRFRLRHRDGRDKYQFLFITATWTRGGNLPAMLEMIVQRAPQGFNLLRGEDVFPYLNGFIPATAVSKAAQGQSQQQITVPSQTATTTKTVGGETNNLGDRKSDDQGGLYASITAPVSLDKHETIAPFGVNVSAGQVDSDIDSDESALEVPGLVAVAEPSGKMSKDTHTTLQIRADKVNTDVLFQSSSSFTVQINHTALGKTTSATVYRTAKGWACAVYAGTDIFLRKGIVLVVSQNGQTRTLKFEEIKGEQK